MKRNIYLNSVDYKEVPNILDKLLQDINFKMVSETVSVKETLGRMTYLPVYANVSSPSYNASAMDGIAIRAIDSSEATDSNPAIIKDYIEINTGNIVPNEFDAVVMIEDVQDNGNGTITLIKSVSGFENIRPIGEDIVIGELILPKYHKIRPIDISALLSAQISTIDTVKLPKVIIIPTGDEITEGIQIERGKIVDSNSYYTKFELLSMGIDAAIAPIQKDNLKELEQYILEASMIYDLVIIGAGSSAGTKDYVKSIIETNGTVYCHGINIKPGKPTIIGTIKGTPIIGMPGYPVSTYMAFEVVVRPMISKMCLEPIKPIKMIKAKVLSKVYSSLKNHEFIRVTLGKVKNEIIAIPLSRKAGVTMSLVKADGIMVIPKNSEGYNAGEQCEIMLLKELDEIENNLIVIGSHDIMFDVMETQLIDMDIRLTSSHVGSYGGIMSMKNGQCDIAPVHILHDNGEYNSEIIDIYLDNTYRIIRGVSRIQGLYVKKGNPKHIKKIKDLLKSDISFVNRQRGSGTRILFDYLLEQNKIPKKDIKGYKFELPSHVLVAESVKDDRFDVGMGVESVAIMHNLDFVRISEEKYDFLVHKDFLDTEKYSNFIKVLKSNKFKTQLKNIGGYRFENIGTIVK